MKNKTIAIFSVLVAALTFGLVLYKNKSEKEEKLRNEDELKKQKELDDLKDKISILEQEKRKKNDAELKAKKEAEKKQLEEQKKAQEKAQIEAEKDAIKRSKLFKVNDNVKLLKTQTLPIVYVDSFGAIQSQRDASNKVMFRYFKSNDIIGRVDRITKLGNVIVRVKDGKLVSVSSREITKI